MATANSCSTLQNALKSVKEFLLKANEFTKKNEHLLEGLAEIAKILEVLANEKEVASTDIQRIEEITKICESLLFGSLIELIIKMADKFSMMEKIESNQKENKQSNLTEVMQIKYDEVKCYLEKAKGRQEAIDKMLSELVPKIREACRKKFKIPDEDITDLEMDAEDLNCELEACKKYLEDAEKVIVMLESDINEELSRFGIKIVAGAAGVASAVLFAGAFSTDLRAVAEQAYARLGTAFSTDLRAVAEQAYARLGTAFSTDLRAVAQQAYARLGTALLFGAAAVTGAVAFSLLVWKGRWFSKEKNYFKSLLIFRNHSRLMKESDCISLRLKEIRSRFVF